MPNKTQVGGRTADEITREAVSELRDEANRTNEIAKQLGVDPKQVASIVKNLAARKRYMSSPKAVEARKRRYETQKAILKLIREDKALAEKVDAAVENAA